MNYGLDLKREEEELCGDEHQFGASSPKCIASISMDSRQMYFPEGEVQRGKEDFMDCVTRGGINIFETKFTYLYFNKLSEENKEWLRVNGYFVDGKILFSDRFNAILSNTTRQGNSMKAPAHSFHRDGLIPKSMLPASSDMMWAEYHDPSKITQEMKDLGQEFLRRFPIGYDQVRLKNLEEVLTKNMVSVGGHAWSAPKNGEYPRTERPYNHVFVAYKLPLIFIFDNYIDSVDGDFIKKLAKDYRLYKYGYRFYIPRENIVGKKKPYWFVQLAINFWKGI